MERKAKMEPRPGRGSRDAIRNSGAPAAYSVKDGRLTTAYVCPCHGYEFETRQILSVHRKSYHTSIAKDFDSLVRTGNLGQPAWERLPGETPLQYQRFKSYLASHHPKTGTRSIDRVAATVNRSDRVIRTDALRWHWVLRADLWDRHTEQAELAQFEREKRASAQRQARLGQKLQEVARAGAISILGDEARVAELSGNEIAKLADVGTKIERLANSDPTAISDERGQVRLVWEGPRPSWAPQPPEPREPHTRNVTLESKTCGVSLEERRLRGEDGSDA
jgi:hypothetical protein